MSLPRRALRFALFSVYTILLAEGYLRVFAPVPLLPRYVQATEYGIRGNSPDESYVHTSPEYRVQIRTNDRGVRADGPISYEKPKGTVRIVALGDSFTMGYGASLKQTYLSQLSRALGEKGTPVEVINLGVSGHGNTEELIALQNEGIKYEPDLVIVGWHFTDYWDNVRSGLFRLEEDKLVKAADSYLPGVKTRELLFSFAAYRFLAENSQLYGFLRENAAGKAKEILERLRSAGDVPEDEPEAKEDSSETAKLEPQINAAETENGASPAPPLPLEERYGGAEARLLTAALLQELRTTSEAHGANFLVLDIPAPIGRAAFEDRFLEADENLENIHVYRPHSVFRKQHGKMLYWERSHGHFTPLGNQLVGRGLASYIVASGLLSTNPQRP